MRYLPAVLRTSVAVLDIGALTTRLLHKAGVTGMARCSSAHYIVKIRCMGGLGS
jgi:hypothetical protein